MLKWSFRGADWRPCSQVIPASSMLGRLPLVPMGIGQNRDDSSHDTLRDVIESEGFPGAFCKDQRKTDVTGGGGTSTALP
jgi:hypothetical protein